MGRALDIALGRAPAQKPGSSIDALRGIVPPSNDAPTPFAPPTPDSSVAPQSPRDFLMLKNFENRRRVGRSPEGLWNPHPSVEGGNPTIGFGHRLTDEEIREGNILIGEDLIPFVDMSDEDIDALFQQDTKIARDFVDKRYNRLNGDQREALTSLVYNVGRTGFSSSRAGAALAEYQTSGSPDALSEFIFEAFDAEVGFVNAAGKVFPGLVSRRRDEQALFETIQSQPLNLRGSLDVAVRQNPDDQAKMLRQAAALGLSPSAGAADPVNLDITARKEAALTATEDAPVTRSFLANPDLAAVVAADAENLAKKERAVGKLGTARNQAGRSFAEVFISIPKTVAIKRTANAQRALDGYDAVEKDGIRGYYALMRKNRPTGHLGRIPVRMITYNNAGPLVRKVMRFEAEKGIIDPTKRASYKIAARIEKAVADALPLNPKHANDLLTKFAAGGGSLAGFALAGALSGPLALPMMASLGATNNASALFTRAIAEGATVEEAIDVAEWGFIIGTLEAVPIIKALHRFARAKGGFRDVVKNTALGGIEELTQEGGMELLNNMVLEGILEIDLEKGVWTGVGESAGIGGTLGAALSFFLTMAGGRRGRGTSSGASAQQAKEIILEVDEAIKASDTHVRSPEISQQHTVETLRAQGVEDVRVPIEALLDAVGEQSAHAADTIRSLGVEDQVQAAVIAGSGEIVISVEAFGSEVLGQDILSSLVDHIKLNETIPTVAEHAGTIIAMQPTLFDAVRNADISSDLKSRALVIVEDFSGKTVNEVVEKLLNSRVDEQRVINELVDEIIAREADIEPVIAEARAEKLDDEITALEEKVALASEKIETRQEEGKPTVAAERQRDKLVVQRQALEQEQADVLFPKQRAGEFEATRKKGVVSKLRKKTIQVKAKVLEDLNVRTTRESIRAARQAFKEGLKVGRKNVKTAQTLLNKLISGSSLDAAQKDKFRGTIISIQTFEQLQQRLPGIQARLTLALENQRKKELTKAIKKVLSKHKTKSKDGKPVGRLTPEVSALVDRLAAALKMTKDQAAAALRLGTLENLEGAGMNLENMLLAMVADPTNVPVAELENLLISLSDVIIEAKAIGTANALHKTAVEEKTREDLIEAIGPDVEVRSKTKEFLNDAEVLGFLGPSGSWWNKLQRVMSSSDTGLVTGLQERLSLFKESRAYEIGTAKRINTVEALMQERTGLSKRQVFKQLRRDMSEKVTLGTFSLPNKTTKTISMTRAEMRSAWMALQNQDLRDQIMNPESNAWTQEVIDSIQSNMTSFDIQVANAQLEFYDGYYTDINTTYEKAYGVSLPKIEVYSPISRQVGGDQTLDEFLNGALHMGSIVPGSVKSRVPNRRAFDFRPDTQVLSSHVIEMEYFIAYQEKVSLLNAVFFGRNAKVASLITSKYGRKVMQTIRNDLEFFAKKGVLSSNVTEKAMVTLMRNFGAAQLFLKPQIMLKQLGSFSAMVENVNVKDFVVGMAVFTKNPKKALRLLNKSSYFKNRGIRIDRDFSDMLSDKSFLNILGKHPTLTHILSANIRWGDKGAIAFGGFAHVHAQMKAGKSEAEALRSFERLANRTQQSSDPDQVSEFQRGTVFQRVVGQFMSSANALARGEYSAIVEGARGRITKKELAKRLVVYHLVIPNIIQIIANGFDWESDDQLRASLLGAMNGIILFGDLAAATIQYATGGEPSFRGIDIRHPISFFQDILDAIDSFVENGVSFEDWMEGNRAIDKAARGIGALTGIPLATLNNMLRGTAKVTDAALSGDRRPGEKAEEGAKLMLGYSPYIIDRTK